jgi:hypothetical protein
MEFIAIFFCLNHDISALLNTGFHKMNKMNKIFLGAHG